MCHVRTVASVRIPGAVAHIEIEFEVNKWESGLGPELEKQCVDVQRRALGLDWKHPALSVESLSPGTSQEFHSIPILKTGIKFFKVKCCSGPSAMRG